MVNSNLTWNIVEEPFLWKPANIKVENNGAVVYPDSAQSFGFFCSQIVS